MRELFICKNGLESVDVIDDVIEICAIESRSGRILLKITHEAWDEICIKVMEEMERGATGEEEV